MLRQNNYYVVIPFFFKASRIAQYNWLMVSGHSGQYPVVENNNIEIEISNGTSLQIINQEQ